VGGFDEHIPGTSGHLQVAVGFQLGRGPVIDHVVGAQDVVAIVNHDLAREGAGVAHAGLAFGVPRDGHAGGGLRLRLGHRNGLLPRIVGKRGGGR
jgi:hypothetical protein